MRGVGDDASGTRACQDIFSVKWQEARQNIKGETVFDADCFP